MLSPHCRGFATEEEPPLAFFHHPCAAGLALLQTATYRRPDGVGTAGPVATERSLDGAARSSCCRWPPPEVRSPPPRPSPPAAPRACPATCLAAGRPDTGPRAMPDRHSCSASRGDRRCPPPNARGGRGVCVKLVLITNAETGLFPAPSSSFYFYFCFFLFPLRFYCGVV